MGLPQWMPRLVSFVLFFCLIHLNVLHHTGLNLRHIGAALCETIDPKDTQASSQDLGMYFLPTQITSDVFTSHVQ